MSVPLRNALRFCVRGECEAATQVIEGNPELAQQSWDQESFEVPLGPNEWPKRNISRGDTALIAASMANPGCSRQQNEILQLVKLIVDKGGVVSACNLAGWDALICAAFFNNTLVLNFLIEKGAQINRPKKMSALHWACRKNHPEICLALLSHGADLFSMHAGGMTPLQEYGVDSAWSWQATKEQQALQKKALLAAWRAGPHPTQIQRRKDEAWAPRWPLMSIVVSCGFRPLAAKLALLKISALAPSGSLPLIILDTHEKVVAYRRALVFSNDGLLRAIVSFL